MATERDSNPELESQTTEIGREERAIGKTAVKGITGKESAALIERNPAFISKKRNSLEKENLLESEGKGRAKTYSTNSSVLNGDLTLEEILHKDFETIKGTLLEDASIKEISEIEGVTKQAIYQRRKTLENNGFLSSEGQRAKREYHPGIRLVDRLNRMDKINHGRATPFSWNPDESRVFWSSEENDAETLDELDMLDRLAFRIDQSIDSDDYRMPDLDHLDPFRDRNGEEPEQENLETSTRTLEMERDDVFSILNSPRRRHVMRYLLDVQPEKMDLGELSRNIAAMENEKNPHEVNSKERKNVYVGLYQTHLSKLDDKGIIVYDERSGSIFPTNRLLIFDDFLEDDFWDYSETSSVEEETVFGETEDDEFYPIFENHNGVLVINPNNEDLRQAIEERYEEDQSDQADIDMFDISDSDIEQLVNAFELNLEEEEDQSPSIGTSIETALENVQSTLAEIIREGGDQRVFPEHIGLQDVLDRDELVIQHLENSEGVSTQEEIAENYDWNNDEVRRAIVEAMESYDVNRVPKGDEFQVFIPGRRKKENNYGGSNNGSRGVEEVESPSERFTSTSAEQDSEEEDEIFDENVLESGSIENDDVSKLVTLLEGNMGQMSGKHVTQFYEGGEEEVKDTISEARDMGIDIGWKPAGQGFVVVYRDYEEDSMKGLQGQGLWDRMKNGREIDEKEIGPDDLMPNGNYESRHVKDEREKRVVECLDTYPNDRIPVSELESELDGMRSPKTRKVVAYLVNAGIVEMEGDEIIYESGGPTYFRDW